MRKIFLHLGFPKSFSTTLQRSLFEAHPDITYGGVGIGSNIGYANEDIEFVFECLLKYANTSFFEEEKKSTKKSLKFFIDAIPEANPIVFSSEHLIFPFSLQHLDFNEIFRRLQYLFEGYEIHCILVLRRQDTLIKSIYGEYVKMGYPETYSEFIQWIWAFRDRNFWNVLQYDKICNNIGEYFGTKNIHIQFFEHFKLDPQQNINLALSQILEIPNKNLSINNNNPSLNEGELETLLKRNVIDKRGMGNHILSPFENFRNKVSLNRLQSGYTNDEIFSEVYAKRLALVKMKQSLKNEKSLLYQLSPMGDNILKKMKVSWRQTNMDLKMTGLELPSEYCSI